MSMKIPVVVFALLSSLPGQTVGNKGIFYGGGGRKLLNHLHRTFNEAAASNGFWLSASTRTASVVVARGKKRDVTELFGR